MCRHLRFADGLVAAAGVEDGLLLLLLLLGDIPLLLPLTPLPPVFVADAVVLEVAVVVVVVVFVSTKDADSAAKYFPSALSRAADWTVYSRSHRLQSYI